MSGIPLSLISPANGARVLQQGDAAVLITAPEQWGYSAQAEFVLPGIDQQASAVKIRLSVERGEIGLGWLRADGSDWVARCVPITSANSGHDIIIEVPRGTDGGRLVFDNAAKGGQRSVAIIHGIVVGERDDISRAQIRAAFNSDHWTRVPTNGSELERFEKMFERFDSPDEFLDVVAPRPAMQNFAKSIWEYAHGKTVLTTYPWNVTIPVADLCNARCTFCTSWLDGRKILDLDELDKFEPVLRHALQIGLVGHGEPMAHPRFDELCERIAESRDPAAAVYTITNGFFIDKWHDHLDRINLNSLSVSLNAATAETHDLVMGLGPDAFPRIVDSIKDVIDTAKRTGNARNLHITLVVTQQNLHEIPAFVELGNRLGVTSIWFRVLLPQPGLIPGLNYHVLPPYMHPDFDRLHRSAVAAIQASEVPVTAEPGVWGNKIFSETLEQELRLRPPPTVSREDALRDRDLRQRNQFLYKQEKGIFRGRALESGANSKISWAGGRLNVTTPKAHGAYAAAVPIQFPDEADGELHVEVEVTCGEGVLGLGLFDVAKNDWLDRVFVEPAAEATVVLKATASGQKIQLLIDNGGEGTPASGSVGAARIKIAGIGQSLPVEWGGLVMHNAADLLDDGTNPLEREPRFACKAVYYNLYINEFFYRISPCCYLQSVPGFEEVRLDGDMTFMEGWNSPGMVELRRRLTEGPLYGACMRCPEKW